MLDLLLEKNLIPDMIIRGGIPPSGATSVSVKNEPAVRSRRKLGRRPCKRN